MQTCAALAVTRSSSNFRDRASAVEAVSERQNELFARTWSQKLNYLEEALSIVVQLLPAKCHRHFSQEDDCAFVVDDDGGELRHAVSLVAKWQCGRDLLSKYVHQRRVRDHAHVVNILQHDNEPR